MNTWFISDTFFGSEKIIKLQNRPFASPDEMDELMILNWNQKVKAGDLVYHFSTTNGDESELSMFSKRSENYIKKIVSKLNGNKIIIRGEEDYTYSFMREMGYLACLESAFIKMGDVDCYISSSPHPISAPFTWMLHGGTSHSWKILPVKRKICLSAHLWDYAPVSEKELLGIIEKIRNPWDRKKDG